MKQVLVGDLRMHVVDQGTGPVLLFVHGFPLHHGLWRHQVEEFARDCRVLAPDLRGFGGTPAVGNVATMANLADDLAGVLDVLCPSEPITFVGLSLGGYIAFAFSQRHARRLGRLVLCDTRSAADSPAAAAGRLQMADRVLQEGPEIVTHAMLPKVLGATTVQNQPELVAFVKDDLMGKATAAGIAAVQRGMAERPDVTPLLSSLRVPTLVVVGEEDVISPPAEMRAIAAAIPGARFEVIPQAGHLSPLENPPAFNAALRLFLDATA